MIKHATSWNDITLAKADEIEKLQNITDEDDKLFSLVKVSLLENAPITMNDFFIISNDLGFFGKPVPDTFVRTKFNFNGSNYIVTIDVEDIIMAQFMDFSIYTQNKIKDRSVATLLSCFVIPKGHTYNDGYNVGEVVKTIHENMSIVDATALLREINKTVTYIHNSFPTIFIQNNVEVPQEEEGEENREEEKKKGFMGTYWHIVMMKKVADLYNCDMGEAVKLNVFEFLNLYGYQLAKEKLEENARKEEIRKIKQQQRKYNK